MVKEPVPNGSGIWTGGPGPLLKQDFQHEPKLYAVIFSSLYSALMLILFALILRGVSFEFRGKVDDPRWRKIWDTCIFIGSFMPALLFGVVFANIFKGIPIDHNGIFQSLARFGANHCRSHIFRDYRALS